jgi:hypothetical protein
MDRENSDPQEEEEFSEYTFETAKLSELDAV